MVAIRAALILLAMPGSVAAQDVPVRWQLSTHPSLAIGGEGKQHTEFLRVGTVVRLAGGEIAVPTGGAGEIRIFDRSGRYLRSLGRNGAGSGASRSPSLVGHAGDTLFIADGIDARITLFLASGRLVKTIPITARDAAGRFSVVGRLPDGQWAVVTESRPNIYGPQRIYRDTARVGVIAPDASGPVSWLGEFPGPTFFVYNPSNAPQGDVVASVPLGPTSVSAVSGGEVLIGDTGGGFLGAYSAGVTLRLMPVPLEPEPLTDETIAQLRKQALTRNPSERARSYLTALHSRAVMGRSLPVFKSIVPAGAGLLWVQPFPADPAEPISWLVLDSLGKPKARILVPGGFRITEVGSSYVLGVHTDAGGVETVRMYQFTPQ